MSNVDIAALPLDTVIALAGQPVHTSWIGGEKGPPRQDYWYGRRFGLGVRDWYDMRFKGEPDPGYLYVSGPDTATDIHAIMNVIAREGWKTFFPFSGRFGSHMRDHVPWNINIAAPVGNQVDHGLYFTGQAVVTSRLSNTRMPDGKFPIWDDGGEFNPADYGPVNAAIAGYAPWNTFVLVVDGSGSASSGNTYRAAAADLVERLPNTRIIVVKFSDFPDPTHGTTDPDDIPGLVVGRWSRGGAATAPLVIDAIENNPTGGGGDAVESGFEGIATGLKDAANQSWNSGHIGVALYLIDASVVVFSTEDHTYTRLNQRDDGLGIVGHARMNGPGNTGNRPTSEQQAGAPRIRQTPNTYS